MDTDVISVKSARELDWKPFFVTERAKNVLKRVLKPRSSRVINGNVIFNPKPISGNIIDLAYDYSVRFPRDRIVWSQIGPQLLTDLIKSSSDHGFAIMAPEFANSINWWECPYSLLKPAYSLGEKVAFLHCYNERWRRAGIDKNAPFPEDSLMSFFANKYL